MGDALSLRGGIVLVAGSQHFDAEEIEAPVGAHRLAQSGCLRLQRGLFHHLARQSDMMRVASGAQSIGEGLPEALTDMIVVADQGDLPLWLLPKKLRQHFV